MRKYELLFITNAEYDDEKVASVTNRYQDLITRSNGTVLTSEKWGKRRLAYEINDLREGLYILMTFDAEHAVASEIDRLMKIDQDILRHMISRLDLVKPRATGKKASVEEGQGEPRVESAESAPAKVVKEAPVGAALPPAPAPKTEENPQG